MYGTEEQLAAMSGVTQRTYRKWCWFYISWDTRLRSSQYNRCFVTVDGTDCSIMEPQPFNRRWFSHKLRSAGIRYEIALSINGDIVWVNGPYPCGSHPDVVIFRDRLKSELLPGELVLADNGYGDERCLTPRNIVPSERR
eukprot:IDg19284t1